MKLHEEVLTKKALKVAEKLGEVLSQDFYLAGGTGLALQIGHRRSLDFDLFSEKNKLRENERRAIIDGCKNLGKTEIVESTEGTCHLFMDDIAVSMFYYNYPLIKPLKIEFKNILLASLEDIAAMKLSAVMGRGTKKDFIDIFYLAKELGFEKMLRIGVKKFKDHKNFVVQATRALVYFYDAEKDPMPYMLENAGWDEIKSYLEVEIKKYLKIKLKI